MFDGELIIVLTVGKVGIIQQFNVEFADCQIFILKWLLTL